MSMLTTSTGKYASDKIYRGLAKISRDTKITQFGLVMKKLQAFKVGYYKLP